MTDTAPSSNTTADRRPALSTPPSHGPVPRPDVDPIEPPQYSRARIFGIWAAYHYIPEFHDFIGTFQTSWYDRRFGV